MASNEASFQNNIFYSVNAPSASGWRYQGNDYGSWALWKAAEGANDTAFADPLFRSTTDFRLKAGSPAINAGVDVGLTTDFLGKPIRGVPDIGAYEFYGATGGMMMGLGVGF